MRVQTKALKTGSKVLAIACLLACLARSTACLAQGHCGLGVGLNSTQVSAGNFVGGFRFVTEAGFNRRTSLRADLVWTPIANGWREQSNYGKVYNIWIKGWGIDVGPRFYLGRPKQADPSGFFLQPNFVYRRIQESFIGFQVDDALPPKHPESFPFLDISEQGNSLGFGLFLGWKLLFEHIFVEPGFSIDYSSARYATSENHGIIAQYYETSELFNVHLQLNIGYSSAKKSKKKEGGEVPSIKIGGKQSYSLLTLYSPFAMIPENEPYVTVNDTVVGVIGSGQWYEVRRFGDSLQTVVGLKNIALPALSFVSLANRQYFIRVVPARTRDSKAKIELVTREKAAYEMRKTDRFLLQRNKMELRK